MLEDIALIIAGFNLCLYFVYLPSKLKEMKEWN